MKKQLSGVNGGHIIWTLPEGETTIHDDVNSKCKYLNWIKFRTEN